MGQSIEITERDDVVVVKHESKGIEARGDTVSTALQTLSEKLEIDRYREKGI